MDYLLVTFTVTFINAVVHIIVVVIVNKRMRMLWDVLIYDLFYQRIVGLF